MRPFEQHAEGGQRHSVMFFKPHRAKNDLFTILKITPYGNTCFKVSNIAFGPILSFAIFEKIKLLQLLICSVHSSIYIIDANSSHMIRRFGVSKNRTPPGADLLLLSCCFLLLHPPGN
jgi:hypothetical protein